MTLRKIEVGFMSLSCIVQTLWDLCQRQVICHLDKNGCKLEQKHFIKKIEKICRVAHGLKKERKQGRS